MERHTSADQSCGRFAELIHDRADGALDAGAQSDLDGHLASCAGCRALAADLEAMRRTSAELPDLTPRAEVWASISQRLAGEFAARPRHFWTGARVALALAATLLVAVASSVWVLRSPAPASPPGVGRVARGRSNPIARTSSTLTNTSASPTSTTSRRLPAWAGGEGGEGTLDPALAATLQKNLGVIDQAITESREAIKAQPNNQLAQTRPRSRRSGRAGVARRHPSRSSTSCERATRGARY
jgi:hypothetical protein